MIKLIVSDLDGTLLQNGSQQLTPRAIPIILRILESGVRFVAASGRQYPNLCRLFGEASKDMAFICENGAYVAAHGEVIQKTHMEQNKAKELALDILNQPGCELLLSGACTSYLIPKTDSLISDFLWMDFIDKSVNKGTALAALLSHWKISAEDVVAFGDNYNDLEMLSLVKYGYVMEYAAPDIRCRYSLTTSCVEDILDELLAGF